MLNPKSITVQSAGGDYPSALSGLDAAIDTAVATAKTLTKALNQIEIIPGLLVQDTVNSQYLATATVIYPG